MATREIWIERVRQWRESGLSSPKFCQGRDFRPGGLRYWASRLKQEAEQRASTRRRRAKSVSNGAPKSSTRGRSGPVRIARVIRQSPGAPPVTATTNSIVFDFGGARVAVRPDFDREAMRDLLALLGERGDEVALRRVR